MPLSSVLDVDNSFRGRRWAYRAQDDGAIESLQNQLGLDHLTSRLLVGRGIDAGAAQDYLDPKIMNFMPDPSTLGDMDKAVKAIIDAVEAKKNIAIFADYDVDGATSAAQLIRWGRGLGQEFDLYVPDRIREGYGPSEQAFEALKSRGAELVITVDCGAAAYSALTSAEYLGLEIIVIDHHLMDHKFPPCRALVNPNRPDDKSELGFLAAAGVTFMVLAGLNRELRRRGYEDVPNLVNMLGLTALGTICDVVPLTSLNRAIVRQGLKVLSGVYNPGIAALADVSQVAGPFTTYHAGFVLGPRINAGGRIGQADMGARMLSTENTQEAYGFAAELDRVNKERKRLQEKILFEANESVNEKDNLQNGNVIVTSMEGWHAGIIGIVAGRLKDRLGLPVIVIGIDEDGLAKGSGRSIKGVNLGASIKKAKEQGLLISGGGHAMAGGLTILAQNIEKFEQFIQDDLREDVISARNSSTYKVDGLLSVSAISSELVRLIDRVGPFGANNPVPVFAFANLRIAYAERLRGGHVRCSFVDNDGSRISAICFSAEETGMADILLDPQKPRIHVAGRIKQDSWNGRQRIDLQVTDLSVVKNM